MCYCINALTPLYLPPRHGLGKEEVETLIRERRAPRVLRSMAECSYVQLEESITCVRSYPYRSFDGSCNNLDHTLWGRTSRAFARYLAPDYGDGYSSPRLAKSGQPLPSARDVSLSIHDDVSQPSHVHTRLHMAFGQFMDHDMVKTASAKLIADDGSKVDPTCGGPDEGGCATDGPENEECFPISLNPGDEDFGHLDCLSFVRSQGGTTDDCAGPRQQLNQITSVIDASNVYGSDEAHANSLRDLGTGRLLYRANPTNPGGQNLLPAFDDSACTTTPAEPCIVAGDGRANEQVGLTALHTLFFRMHNALVDDRTALNPQWDGEKLYQEARRIVGATLQVIVYQEYLPVVLGPTYMDTYNLTLRRFKNHDNTLSVDAPNVFAAAAFRFGHSQLGDNGPGPDIAALSIQRGRDHGLPGYNAWREFCGLPKANRFSDLADTISSQTVRDKLEQLYEDVDDIDLYAGAMSETSVSGGIVGPTFACIQAKHFRNLKYGDRFWHERGNRYTGFSREQLAEIRKITLARVICDNLDNVQTIQKRVFMQPLSVALQDASETEAAAITALYDGETNDRVNCSDIPQMDLTPWQ
nr:thyroid peroxidase-like protein [Arenicola marina]